MTRVAIKEQELAQVAAPIAHGWAANTFDAFRFPVYRTIWFGTVLAFLAFNMSATAQGSVAYDLTGSNRAVGLVMFGQGLAMVLLNPFGGAIADRFSKRLLLIVAQGVIGSVMLATAILLATDQISILYLACASFTMGCMFSFMGPARTALIGDVVSDERIGNAVALIQVGGNFSRIGGPSLAGLLLSWSAFDATGVYFLNAFIFVLVVLTMFRIPSVMTAPAQHAGMLADIRSGFAYVRNHPHLLHNIAGFHLITTLGLSYMVLMPGFAKDVLDAGNAGFGALLASVAVGGFVMSVIVASLADSRRAPMFLTVASFAIGAGMICLSVSPSLVVAMLAMVLLGAAASGFQTLNNAVALRMTHKDYYGRVISIIFMAWGITSLSSLFIGFLADAFGERAVLACIGGVLIVIAALLTLWRNRLGPNELLLAATEERATESPA